MGGGASAMTDEKSAPLVVGISGASGAIYGVRVLDACRELGVETHLVVSRAAVLTLAQEQSLSLAEVSVKATVFPGRRHRRGDFIGLVSHDRHGGRALLDAHRRGRSRPARLRTY